MNTDVASISYGNTSRRAYLSASLRPWKKFGKHVNDISGKLQTDGSSCCWICQISRQGKRFGVNRRAGFSAHQLPETVRVLVLPGGPDPD
jgi:hypothetical protein